MVKLETKYQERQHLVTLYKTSSIQNESISIMASSSKEDNFILTKGPAVLADESHECSNKEQKLIIVK